MTDQSLVERIQENYQKTLAQIADAAHTAGREPESVELVVVTKKQPLSIIEAAIAAGVKIFGENYPEEAVKKMQSLGEKNTVEWHMIGHVYILLTD